MAGPQRPPVIPSPGVVAHDGIGGMAAVDIDGRRSRAEALRPASPARAPHRRQARRVAAGIR